MESCCACLNFLRLSLTTSWDRDEKDWCLYTTKRACSLDERRAIKDAEDCQLCRQIHDFLQDIYGDEFDVPDEDGENGEFIQMEMIASSLPGEEHLISSILLSCDPNITDRPFVSTTISFSAWAENGMLPTYVRQVVMSDFG